MTNPRHLLFVTSMFAAGCVSEAQPPPLEAEPDPEAEIPAPREEIARIALSPGEVTYHLMTDTGEIAMLARSVPDAHGQLSVLDQDLSPLDAYLALTAADTPVPRALAATDPARVPAGRAIADKLVVATASDQARSDHTSQATAGQMCNEGGSSETFLSEVCSLLAEWDVSFCHNGTWYSVTDEWSDVTTSRGVTLACGGTGRVRHHYKSGGVWYKVFDWSIPSGEIWQSTYTGNTSLTRKITHSRIGQGFVRAASWFR